MVSRGSGRGKNFLGRQQSLTPIQRPAPTKADKERVRTEYLKARGRIYHKKEEQTIPKKKWYVRLWAWIVSQHKDLHE